MKTAGFTIPARSLVAGESRGKALVLEDTLSFWGGFDPTNGAIIDVHHPQFQQQVGNRILFIPRSKGSAGTPGGIAETLRNGSGPLAFVLGEADVNISVGVLVANQLYGLQVPVIEIAIEDMNRVANNCDVCINRDGQLIIVA